jgi:peptide chain release factor 2
LRICSGSRKNFASASSSCGAIFDVARSRETLASLEARISEPDFWQDQEQAQKVMQQRKAADAVLSSDAKLASMASDLETYFHLAEEETDAARSTAR